MTKKSREILEFVESLEMHELNGEQEGVLLGIVPEQSHGGSQNYSNTKCINNWRCNGSSNYYCSNDTSVTSNLCSGSVNFTCPTGGISRAMSEAGKDGHLIDTGFSGVLGL